MFNILNFFKKKPTEPASPESSEAEPVAEKQIQINDLVIHTMPVRFRHQPSQANNAKTTGLLIIGGGVVVLILSSAGLYYYLFKKPAAVIPEAPPAAVIPGDEANQARPAAEQNIPTLEILTSTTTESMVLPADDSSTAATASSAPATVEQELTAGLALGLDSDSDGLTDAAEIILATSTSTPDTDSDLYLDGVELLNLYDPAGLSRLTANVNIALYENKTFNYNVLYPRAWPITVNGGDDSIMFKTPDNQFFLIIVQPNTGQASIDQWYFDQLGAATINESDRVFGSTWQGLKSLDGLTLYLMDAKQKNIFTLAYNPGENNVLEYIDIFKMMIRSFILQEQP